MSTIIIAAGGTPPDKKEFLDYVRLFKLDYAMKERIIELISEM